MSTTISSNLPAPDGQSILGQSLANLSARAQPAQTVDSDGDLSDIGEDQYVGPAFQVAQQNRYSALADNAAASAATQSAAAGMDAQPDSAIGVQANVSAESAWGLLQNG